MVVHSEVSRGVECVPSDDEEEVVQVKRGSVGGSRRVRVLSDSDDDDRNSEKDDGVLGSSEVAEEEPASSRSSRPTCDTDAGRSDDLYDAELGDDSGGEDSDAGRERGSSEEEHGPASDEENHISDALRKKLAKGAAKKPRTQRKAAEKARQKNLSEIHSETQRLVRESSAQVPYHRPKPADLSTFLARTKLKQQQINTQQQQHNNRLPWKQPPQSSSAKSPAKLLSDTSNEIVMPSCDNSVPSTEVIVPPEPLPVSPVQIATSPVMDFDDLPDLVIEKTSPVKQATDIVPDDGGTPPEITIFIGCDSSSVAPPSRPQEDQADDCKVMNETSPVSKPASTCLTPRLRNLQLPAVVPRLGGGSDVIDLDEDVCEAGTADQTPGVTDLMERLVSHTTSARSKKSHDVTISTVVKETGGEAGREELRLESFKYHVDGKEDAPSRTKPGAKLSALKEHLHTHIRERRHLAREERLRVYRLDNEEEGEGERLPEEEREEEREEEMTDSSNSEEDEEEEDDYAMREMIRKRNPFVEDEADDDDEDYYGNEEEEDDMITADDDDNDVSDDNNDVGDDDTDDEANLHLELDSCEAETSTQVCAASTDDGPSLHLSRQKTLELYSDDACTDSPHSSQQSDNLPGLSQRPFEQLGGDRASGQPPFEEKLAGERDSIQPPSVSGDTLSKDLSFGDSSFDMLPGQSTAHQSATSQGRVTPELLTSHTTSDSRASASRTSSLLLPHVEDSQDLLNDSSLSLPPNNPRPGSLDCDTQSQLLDADGLFKCEVKLTVRRQLDTSMPAEVDEASNMSELLGLCSGQFNAGASKPVDQSQTDMSELLGLCSGQFGGGVVAVNTQNSQDTESMREPEPSEADSPVKSSTQRKKKKRRVYIEDDDSGHSDLSLEIASDTEPVTMGFSESLDSDEDVHSPQKFSGFTDGSKHGKIRRDFVEEEAELSGSEVSGDEEEDEEDDELELEDGDADDVGSQRRLHQQVNRIHLKELIDSDKKQIRHLQELYLPDGDLHSDRTRTRRFRWANKDAEDGEQGEFRGWDEEEAAEGEGEEERQWRLERHERERFIAEQGESEESGAEIKLGKVRFKHRPVTSSAPTNRDDTNSQPKNPPPKSPAIFKVPKLGSFLSKGKASLAKIAEMTRPVAPSVSGPRHARSLLFTATSPPPAPSKQVKRCQSAESEPPTQPTKRPRLHKATTLPTSLSTSSVFHHL